MIISFALTGIGLFVYMLFAAATYALPLMAALLVGFAMRHAGAPGASPLIVGFLVFVAVIIAGRVATALLPYRFARITIMLIFAVPAAFAGYEIGKGLLSVVGVSGGILGPVLALVVALISALVAANRTVSTPQT